MGSLPGQESAAYTTPLSAFIKQPSGNFVSRQLSVSPNQDGGAADEAAEGEEAAGQGGEAQEAGGGEWMLGGVWVWGYGVIMICVT